MNQPDKREETLFEAALQESPERRSAYLEAVCGGDASLRQRVELLLRVHDQSGEFMKEPAAPATSRTVNLSIPLAEKPGDTIDRYKLLQQIGEGGCGVVYMAEQQEPVRRRVALKVIKLGLDTKSVIARFEAERQALAMMNHPNIAGVLDAGATKTGRPYFVMELVRGVKITEFCDANKLTTEERLELFIQVCQAIQHAHQKGIIHRDIKPSNILVSVDDPAGAGVPKVIDFGIAKATSQQQLTDKTLYTAFEQFLGTPAYVSPEQALMTNLDVDTRTDIYSLGVLLYELLTGRTPFEAGELLGLGLDAMRRTISEKEPLRPSTRLTSLASDTLTTTAALRHTEAPRLIHSLRGDLDWIAMKCLEKDRARRYETASGLAADLRRHLDNEPVLARPPSRLYRFQKSFRRNKLAFLAATAIAGVLVAASIFSTWQAIRAKSAETLAEARAEELVRASEETGAVNRWLLNDLLEQANPLMGGALGAAAKTITLEQAIRKASEKLGDRFANQPAAEARIQEVVGKALSYLGETESGIAHLRRAHALFQQHLGATHTNTLHAQFSLGWHLSLSYGFGPRNEAERKLGEEGRRLMEESYRLHRETQGTNHKVTLEMAFGLGIAYNNAEDVKLAVGIIPDAFETVQGMIRTNSATSLDLQLLALQSMYWLRTKQGRASEAYEILKQLPAFLEKRSHGDLAPTQDALTAEIYGRLGLCARYIDRDNRKAEDLLKRALEIARESSGDSLQTRNTLEYLADFCREEGRTDEAAGYARERLESFIRSMGVGHSTTRWVGRSVASISGDLADWAAVMAELRSQRERGVTDANSLSQELLAAHLAGETDRLPELRRLFWARFREDPAEAARYEVAACLLTLPIPFGEEQQVFDLAERAESDQSGPYWRWCRTPVLQALRAYRQGRFSETVRLLEPVTRNLDNFRLTAFARYFIAMSLQQQGKPSEAGDELHKANQLLANLLQVGTLNPVFPPKETWTTHACSIVARDEAERLIWGRTVSEPITRESLARARTAWKPVHDLLDEAYEAARRRDYAGARDLYLRAREHPHFKWEAMAEDFEWVIKCMPLIFTHADDREEYFRFLRESFPYEKGLAGCVPFAYGRWELPADLRDRIQSSIAAAEGKDFIDPASPEGPRYWALRHAGMVRYRLGDCQDALKLLQLAADSPLHNCSISAKAYAALAAWKLGRRDEANKWQSEAEGELRARCEAGSKGVFDPAWWPLAETDLALKEARELMGDASSRPR